MSLGMYNQLYAQYSDYLKNPYKYTESDVDNIQGMARANNIKLPRHAASGEFNLMQAITMPLKGFAEGFTTIHWGKRPDTPIEKIGYSIGNLLGFIGIVPLPGGLAVKGATLANKALKLKGLTKAISTAKKTSGLLKLKSAPMAASEFVAKKLGLDATGAIIKGVAGAKALGQFGPAVSNIIQSSVHLGLASAASQWQYGKDAMLESGIGGATVGAGFGAIGQVLGGPATAGKPAYMALKTLAGSLYSGLPSSLREGSRHISRFMIIC